DSGLKEDEKDLRVCHRIFDSIVCSSYIRLHVITSERVMLEDSKQIDESRGEFAIFQRCKVCNLSLILMFCVVDNWYVIDFLNAKSKKLPDRKIKKLFSVLVHVLITRLSHNDMGSSKVEHGFSCTTVRTNYCLNYGECDIES
nr:hypothetical protein [Tanacetum cinerariifolium]